MKKLVPLLLIISLLFGCVPAPIAATPDVNAISTQAVATAYADLTKSAPATATTPPTATAEPSLLILALEEAHLTGLAWAPSGQAIVAAACLETCQLKRYNLDLSQVWSVEIAGIISALDYSADDRLIAALVKNGIQSTGANGKILKAAGTEIWLFNARDGTFLRKWDAEQALTLRFDPSGAQIATTGDALIFWDVTTGKANERLDPEKFTSVVYQSGHLKHAKQSQNFKYGPPPWCQIKTFETVSFSPDRPIIIVGGSGILVSGSGIDVHPYPESYGGGPCYLVAAWHLINQAMLESVGPFDSKEFPNAQNFALQAIIEPNNSFSGLLVMDSGFYPLTSGSRFNDKYGLLKTTDFGLDFAVFAMTGAAISPNAERVAVWGKTRGEQAKYFLNLYDVRTTQQIAQFSLESDSTLSTLSAAFRPDGRMLASLNQSGSLKLWQVKKTLP